MTELTVPRGRVALFGLFSGNSEENRVRVFLRTGVANRLDVGGGYSRQGNQSTLQLTWQALSEQRDKAPFNLLLGYGFTTTTEQEGFYALAVKPLGQLSLTVGWQRLREGRGLGLFAGSYRFAKGTGLIFTAHTAEESGEPMEYNLAIMQGIGDWQLGLWWFNPDREGTVGLSISRQFSL